MCTETIIDRDHDARCALGNDSTPCVFAVQITNQVSTPMNVDCERELLSSCTWRCVDADGNTVNCLISGLDGSVWRRKVFSEDCSEGIVLIDDILCRSG